MSFDEIGAMTETEFATHEAFLLFVNDSARTTDKVMDALVRPHNSGIEPSADLQQARIKNIWAVQARHLSGTMSSSTHSINWDQLVKDLNNHYSTELQELLPKYYNCDTQPKEEKKMSKVITSVGTLHLVNGADLSNMSVDDFTAYISATEAKIATLQPHADKSDKVAKEVAKLQQFIADAISLYDKA